MRCTSKYSYLILENLVINLPITKCLIHSLVFSRLTYYCSLLYNLPLHLMYKLERIQRHAIRILYKRIHVLDIEVKEAIRHISNRKAPGCDGIPIEFLKSGGYEAIRVMTSLCNSKWKKKIWPNDWKKSIYVPI